MKSVKIYNTRQAKKDLKDGRKTPLEASIAKWASFGSILYEMSQEALTSCGLCLIHSLCGGCVLDDCSELAEMQDAIEGMKNASRLIRTFLDLMESKRP